MSKLYKNLDENNPLQKLIIEINKECERKYGAYHDECGLFRSFCRCDDNKFNKFRMIRMTRLLMKIKIYQEMKAKILKITNKN